TPVTTSIHQMETSSPNSPRANGSPPQLPQSMRRCLNASPSGKDRRANSAAKAAANETPTEAVAMPARPLRLNLLRPAATMSAPARGNRSMIGSTKPTDTPQSSLQQIQIVCVDPIPPPENQHDQAQSYGHLRRRYGDDEEGEDVAIHVAELPGEGDKDDVGGVPHDLDAHQDDQRAAPGEDAGDADGEEDRADCDVRRY